MRINVINGFLYGRDLFSFFIWNFCFKLFFQCHHEFYRVERVGTQIFHEGRLVADFLFLHAKLFANNFLDALFNSTHA